MLANLNGTPSNCEAPSETRCNEQYGSVPTSPVLPNDSKLGPSIYKYDKQFSFMDETTIN
jgi:hypothetical protein